MNAVGDACISDFGLATVTHCDNPTGHDGPIARGHSSLWAAPETLKEGRISKEADVFSYGLVAVEVRPFDHQLFPHQPSRPDMERRVPLGSGYSSPGDDQDYARRAPGPTWEHKSARPNREGVGWSKDVLAYEPG